MSRATTADTHVACFSRAIKMELSVSALLSRARSEITSPIPPGACDSDDLVFDS
jgi:hypothetical protein